MIVVYVLELMCSVYLYQLFCCVYVCSLLSLTLSHPHCASFQQDKDNLYFVMDYIPGGDLMSLLIKRGIFLEDLARYSRRCSVLTSVLLCQLVCNS